MKESKVNGRASGRTVSPRPGKLMRLVRSGRRSAPSRRETATTVLTLVTMLVAVWFREGHSEFPGVALLVFSALAWLPLTVRTRWPLAVLATTLVMESLHLALVPWVEPATGTPVAMAAYQPVPVATTLAAYTVAVRMPRVLAWWCGGIAAGGLLIVSLLARPFSMLGTDIVMAELVLLGLGIGLVVANQRDRRIRTIADHAAEMQQAVADERLRIARELHDALAHTLTLVNAKASVATYLISTRPQAAEEALRDITVYTRRALDDVRSTVGLLRGNDGTERDGPREPLPSASDLATLVEATRASGQTITLEQRGEPRELSLQASLASYRIVQEALTNAAKHAPGATVAVVVDWGQHDLTLAVDNSPPLVRRSAPRTPGHGLVGMHERAITARGAVTAGPRADGGFRVIARLPYSTTRDRDEPAVGTAAAQPSASEYRAAPTLRPLTEGGTR